MAYLFFKSDCICATTIMQSIMTLGLDLDMLVLGLPAYDDAAVMINQFQGVWIIISEKYPKVQFIHYAAHSINLVFEIPMIHNCIGTDKTVINFLDNLRCVMDFLKMLWSSLELLILILYLIVKPVRPKNIW